MSGSGRTLRVGILRVRTQEPRRYYVSIQVVPSGGTTAVDAAVRTETSAPSANPDFAASSFVLRLPQPLASIPAERPLLRVELFSAPGLDSADSGGIDGGGTGDLVGSGVFPCPQGDVAASLFRGQRMTAAVALAAASQQAAAGGGDGGWGAEEGDSNEVLLELALLDANLALPGDGPGGKAGYEAAGAAVASPSAPPTAGVIRKPRECRLLVLVSRAENLPLVAGQDGMQPPSTCVVAKRMHDGVSELECRERTRVVGRSCAPSWQQVLSLSCSEAALAGEQLLLAVVDNDNGGVMMKAALPLAPLLPDKHYNLQLVMPGGQPTSAVHLYVTVVLTDCHAAQQRHLRAHMGAAKRLLQARLASASVPLTAMGGGGAPADARGEGGGEVFGVWRLVDRESAGQAPRLSCPGAYTSLDARSEVAAEAALRALSEQHTAVVKAAVEAGTSATEELPLQAAGDQMLWPPEHTVGLLYGASPAAVLQLALYHLPPPAAEQPLGASREQMGARLLGLASAPLDPQPEWGQDQAQMLEGVEMQAADVAQGVDPATVGLEVRWQATATMVAAIESEGYAADGSAASAGRGANAALAAVRQAGAGSGGGGAAGEVVEALVDDCIHKQAAYGRLTGQLDKTSVQLEVMSWRLVDAEKRSRTVVEDNTKLQQLLHEEKEAWRIPQLKLLAGSSFLSREELVERCESAIAAYGRERVRNGELVERLRQLHVEQIETLELKKRYQQLQEAHVEQARSCTDVDGQGGKVAQLQCTLKVQEEIIRNLEALLGQAVQRAKPAMPGDAALERSQQLDAAPAQGDEAQGQAAGEPPTEAPGPDLLAQLAAAQERVQQLEGELELLRQQPAAAVVAEGEEELGQRQGQEGEQQGPGQETGQEGEQQGQEQEGADEQKVRIQQLEEALAASQERIRELTEGGAQEAAPDEDKQRLEGDVVQLTEEKTAAVLRAEYAEGAAEAAQNELIDVTKKCAREIAELKTRLAEKDAMMMGGFGDLDQIRHGDQQLPQMNGFEAVGGGFPLLPDITVPRQRSLPRAPSAQGGSGQQGQGQMAARPPDEPAQGRFSTTPPGSGVLGSAGRRRPDQSERAEVAEERTGGFARRATARRAARQSADGPTG